MTSSPSHNSTEERDATAEDEVEPEELPDACQETIDKISAHATKPGRKLFVEEGNTEAWIASDLVIEDME